MATHNYVRLLGALRKPPKIISLANSRAAMFNIIVINKSRFEKDTYYYNVPTIFPADEPMVGDLVNYKERESVEDAGGITTKNVIKATLCE